MCLPVPVPSQLSPSALMALPGAMMGPGCPDDPALKPLDPWPGPGPPEPTLPEGHRTAHGVAKGGSHHIQPSCSVRTSWSRLPRAAQLGLEGFRTSKGAGVTNSLWLPLLSGLQLEVFQHLIAPANV